MSTNETIASPDEREKMAMLGSKVLDPLAVTFAESSPRKLSKRIMEKRRLSRERQERKHLASKRIPFAGVIVDRQMVRQHRYLAAHGLPYSANIALIPLPRARKTMGVAVERVAA